MCGWGGGGWREEGRRGKEREIGQRGHQVHVLGNEGWGRGVITN